MISKIASAVLLAVLCKSLYNAYVDLKYRKFIYNHQPSKCRILPEVWPGSEDIHVLSSGHAVITSGMRRYGDILHADTINNVGRVFLFDMNDHASQPIQLKIEGNLDLKSFNPHGLSIWEDDDTGEVTVFIISHLPDAAGSSLSGVEKFRLELNTSSLIHQSRIRDDSAMWLMNDVAATGSDSFYFTNFYYNTKPWLVKAERALGLPWGSIGHYDGNKGTVFNEQFFLPNGIALSRSKKHIYLNEYGSKGFVVLRRDGEQLKITDRLSLDSTLDNINVDHDTGRVWLGAHQVPIGMKSSLQNYSIPSQVLLLDVDDENGRVTGVQEILSNDGLTIEGASVAAHFRSALLVGTVEHKLLFCTLDKTCYKC